MVLAVEHIRRMRGGAQAHLMRCDDGGYYVVKFQNNPQHLRILANEMLGTRWRLVWGFQYRVPKWSRYARKLIELTADLVMQLGTGNTACRPGLQFGSRFPGDPARLAVQDFLPDEQLRETENIADFAECWYMTNGPATPMEGRRSFLSKRGIPLSGRNDRSGLLL